MADAKQKKQLYALGALLVVALLVWYYQSAKSPSATGFSVDTGIYTPINAQDFSSVLSQLSKAQSTEYKTTGRNIFVAGAVPVTADPNKPVVPVKAAWQKVGPEPPPPPTPPKLSAIFFGYGQLPAGGARRAFLLDGEEVRIVGEGETVQTNLRILHIGNDSIEFEDINTHLRGSKQIEASPLSPAV
jgi:hypothetical protein